MLRKIRKLARILIKLDFLFHVLQLLITAGLASVIMVVALNAGDYRAAAYYFPYVLSVLLVWTFGAWVFRNARATSETLREQHMVSEPLAEENMADEAGFNAGTSEIGIQEPFCIFTASNDLEAHLIAEMLGSRGISARVEDDLSGAGVIGAAEVTQLLRPRVWVDQSKAQEAAHLIQVMEEKSMDHLPPEDTDSPLHIVCDQCGETLSFPAEFKGTTQECPSCQAYVDVSEDRANPLPIE